MREFRISLAVCTVLALGFFVLGMAETVRAVTSCDFTCTNNCELERDLTGPYACQDGEGIVLSNGANLDMKGYSIECGDSTCYTPAVTITHNGSVIKNTGGTESKIFGPWLPAVFCGGKSGSRVVGIRFEDAHQAIEWCAKVEKNVFVGTWYAIHTNGVANTDYIRDNYIQDGVFGGVDVDGSKNVSVEHNLISVPSGLYASGIDISAATGNLRVENNILLGPGTLIVAGSCSGVGANYCDPDQSSCADCIGDGCCIAPVAPFSFR